MSASDPKGYYALLEITPSASLSEIKAAFRRLAKVYHPDAKTASASNANFRALNEAYETLCDVERRSAYDQSGYEDSGSEDDYEEDEPIPPVVCTRCSKVAVQPRYIVVWTVLSLFIVTSRIPTQGVFCSACARYNTIKASVINGLFGWWSIWGILYTPFEILRNAVGGSHQEKAEPYLLWQNACAFASIGQYKLAYALARKVRNFRNEDLAIRALRLMDALERSGVPSSTPSLKPAWDLRPLSFLSHVACLCVVPGAIALASWASSYHPYPSNGSYNPTYAQSYSPRYEAPDPLPSPATRTPSFNLIAKRHATPHRDARRDQDLPEPAKECRSASQPRYCSRVWASSKSTERHFGRRHRSNT